MNRVMSKVASLAARMGIVALVLLLGAQVAEANRFRPEFCGQCTDGAWILWTQYLGQSETPSLRSAKYWYDAAPAKGFRRGDAAQVYSLMVFDGWDANPNGHVGATWQVTPRWWEDFDLVLLVHLNWSPLTENDCNAPWQLNWAAYHQPTKLVYQWIRISQVNRRGQGCRAPPAGGHAAHPAR